MPDYIRDQLSVDWKMLPFKGSILLTLTYFAAAADLEDWRDTLLFSSRGLTLEDVAPNSSQSLPMPPPWCCIKNNDLCNWQWQYEMGRNFYLSIQCCSFWIQFYGMHVSLKCEYMSIFKTRCQTSVPVQSTCHCCKNGDSRETTIRPRSFRVGNTAFDEKC